MYFSLLKIGIEEAAYWFGPKKKVELRDNFFVTPVILIAFSILHGLVHFEESYFSGSLNFRNFFFYLYLRHFGFRV